MQDSSSVLIVEDETSIREFISMNLKMSGFNTIEASSGEEAVVLYENNNPDVILLDIMLPGIDGFEVCKRIRALNSDVSIIMLTARGEDMDKINGLEIGADDYVIKPFNPLELVARIRALLRRRQKSNSEQINILVSGPFKVDINAQSIFKNEIIIDLTPKEYNLVTNLIKNANKSLERDELLDIAWGKDFFGDPKTLDVHIRRLREKIEDSPSNPKYISTIWGIGYMWKED